MTDKVRENKLRRLAERQGMQLVKSRRRDPNAIDFGCYALVDAATNTAVYGIGPVGYVANADEIEKFLTEPARRS